MYRAVFQYRRAFYEGLRERLDAMGIDLELIYGAPNDADRKKRDFLDVSWGHPIRNRVFRFGSVELFWQPCLHLLRGADLVIVEQANKLLVNLVLIAMRSASPRRLAFWGHGKDFQASWQRPRLRDAFKRLVATRVDWWFAYNETAKRIVLGLGFPAERITSVQNAIDTSELRRFRAETRPEELPALREKLGISGRHVCIYAGGMYPEKRLDFLVEACTLTRQMDPEFEMIFIGAGSDDKLVTAAATKYPWIHYVGPKFDREKVPYFMISRLLLMPGLVGLVVLDSFALGVPLVTTRIPYHSPEIEYLEHGENGWMVEEADSVQAFALATKRLLEDEATLARLAAGCERAALRYTNEEMVERFANGIRGALAS